MAPRKPKKNIGDQVGGWLGGAAKGVQSWSESQARTFTNPYINAAGRALGKNPNLPTSGVREAVSNTAFAAVDVAAPVIGRAAGKAVTAVGRTVANTGVKTRNRNTQYLFHGSSKEGLSSINPTQSYMKNLNLPERAYSTSDIRKAESFADIATRKPDAMPSVYVVAAKKKNIKSVAETAYSNEALAGADSFVTNKPMRVVAEIKTPRYPQTLGNLEKLAKTAIKTDKERKLLSRKRITKYK